MIRLDNVTKSRNNLVMSNLSLTLDQGYIHILAGKNGQGKSTLLKIISGILQTETGKVEIEGVDVDQFKRNKTLSYMADTFPYPMKGMILDQMNRMGMFKNFSSMNFKYFLEKFGLKTTLDLKELSEGNKQAVAFCFAMAKNADVYLLDEPSRYMDEGTLEIMQSILQECMLDEKKTIVIATNSFVDFERIADTLTYIDNGNLLFSIDTEVLNSGIRFIRNLDEVRLENVPILWMHSSNKCALVISNQPLGDPVLGFYEIIKIVGGVV